MNEEDIVAGDPAKFDHVLGADHASEFARTLEASRRRLAGRTLWHINSTAQGGGVAEMLQSVLGYLVGGGIRTRWVVVDGNDEFFDVTKRVHKLLHGAPAQDGSAPTFAASDRAVYEDTLRAETAELLNLVKPGEPVILHDPQTLGLAPILAAAGASVVWTCHVGADEPDSHTRVVWDFLRPYISATSAQVFSRPQYIWEGLDRSAAFVIPPCLDAFSPKNQQLDADAVEAILATAGVMEAARNGRAAFERQDGTEATVTRQASLIQTGPVLRDSPIVCQVSRWDPLKDPVGVMHAFAEHVSPSLQAHLLLAGPDPDAVADDPEGRSTFDGVRKAWSELPDEVRSRVHLSSLPMDDLEENAAIVNAIQRRADVVVQKSLAEGFGLTVAEAMWKGRPVIGSRVGGIQDQIEDGESGRLVEPTDAYGFGAAVTQLLADRDDAARLGAAGHARVRTEYLAPRFLSRYLTLVDSLIPA
jgi:trehalose synthase